MAITRNINDDNTLAYLLNKKGGSGDAEPPRSDESIVDLIYPVGSIYMSVNGANPQTLFGGTWERITGRFLLGATDNGAAGGNSNASIAPGNTGGEASHKLASGECGLPKLTHTVTQPAFTLPNHTHPSGGSGTWIVYDAGSWGTNRNAPTTQSGGTSLMNKVRNTGNPNSLPACTRSTNAAVADHAAASAANAHNNMPPYLAVYIWKRTA